jgi:hypothetical protein
MPTYPIRVPAYLDIHEGSIDIRVVDQTFTIARDIDSAVQTMCLKVEASTEHLRSGVYVSPDEREAIRRFEDHHVAEHGTATRFSMHYQFSGIGTGTEIRCTVCGAREDVTDENF